MGNIQTKQIQAFLSAARHMNFTKAAGELFVSPSTLSREIRQLEEALDTTLFERGSFSLALTPAGELARSHFLALNRQLDALTAELDALKTRSGGSIRVGLHSYLMLSRFYHAVFQRLEQDLSLSFTFSLYVKPKLSMQEDIFIAHEFFPFDSQTYDCMFLFQLPVFLLCGNGTPLAGQRALTPGCGSKLSLYTLYDQASFQKLHADFLADFQPEKVEPVDDIQTALMLIKTGSGVMLADALTLETDIGNYTEVKTGERAAFYTYFRKNDACRAIAEEITALLQKQM